MSTDPHPHEVEAATSLDADTAHSGEPPGPSLSGAWGIMPQALHALECDARGF
ncbi:hypothetical protein [Streptomyces sp. NPDC003006]